MACCSTAGLPMSVSVRLNRDELGLLHERATVWLRGLMGRCGYDCFEFDGGQRPRLSCQRRQVRSIHVTIAMRSCSRVSFFCSRLTKLSMAVCRRWPRRGPWSRPCRGGPERGRISGFEIGCRGRCEPRNRRHHHGTPPHFCGPGRPIGTLSASRWIGRRCGWRIALAG